jgi:hypothetical protein
VKEIVDVPWETYWWRRGGLVFTAIVFASFAVAGVLSTDVLGVAGPVISSVAATVLLVFVVIPWSPVAYVAAGAAGFITWAYQAMRLFAKALNDGVTSRDGVTFAYVMLFVWAACMYAVLWLVLVKPWHTMQWGRRRERRDRKSARG